MESFVRIIDISFHRCGRHCLPFPNARPHHYYCMADFTYIGPVASITASQRFDGLLFAVTFRRLFHLHCPKMDTGSNSSVTTAAFHPTSITWRLSGGVFKKKYLSNDIARSDCVYGRRFTLFLTVKHRLESFHFK